MSARARTTRALAPPEAVTVKVFPERVNAVTLPAVAVAPSAPAGAAEAGAAEAGAAEAGAAEAGPTRGPAAARPVTVRAAASRAAAGERRPRRRFAGWTRLPNGPCGPRRPWLLRMLGSLMGQLLVRS